MSLPTNYNYLQQTKCTDVYVETGIYRGDSLQMAIDAGFKKIIGIDNDIECIKFCELRFDYYKKLPMVKIVHGDSADVLWDTIKDINVPITFFLDSHWQMLEGTEGGKNPFPLMRELDQISAHPLSEQHNIIIDDWHIFYSDRVGYGKEDIKRKLEVVGLEDIKYIANPVIDGMLHVKDRW